jgi:hypothetical protein
MVEPFPGAFDSGGYRLRVADLADLLQAVVSVTLTSRPWN